MKSKVIIKSYERVSEDGHEYIFWMTSEQLAGIDSRVYFVLNDSAKNWSLERRGGYSTELLKGNLVAVAYRYSDCSFLINNIDCIDNDIEKFKEQHEHYIYADGESILFPSLGILYSVSPFREGWEAPRPEVFNKEIVVFSKERLEFYRNLSHVLILQPFEGVIIAGGSQIRFAMTQEQVEALWGKPDYIWNEINGAHAHIIEYYFNKGVRLRYTKSDKGNANILLSGVSIIERDGWQIEINGIRIFQDMKLEEMKSKYKHINSKKQTATVFPTLGIMAVGCGEKKNNRKGADGKYVELIPNDRVNSISRFIDMYD